MPSHTIQRRARGAGFLCPFDLPVGRGLQATLVVESGRLSVEMVNRTSHGGKPLCANRANQNELPEAQFLRGPAGTRGPTAVGSDSSGQIWMAHHISPTLLKFDPQRNMEMSEYGGTNRVYSYSDFTGVTRTMSLGLGTYQHDFAGQLCTA